MLFDIKITDLALLVQSIVLIVSLVILIIQIQKYTKAERLSQYQNVLEKVFAYRLETIEYDIDEPEIAEQLKKGFRGDVDIPYFYHTLNYFHINEILFLLRKQKIIDKEMWSGWENNLRNNLGIATNKKNRIWKRMAENGTNLYHGDYSAFIDGIIGYVRKGINK